MKLLKTALIAVTVMSSLPAAAQEINYSSQDYLLKQYEILRLTFKDLDVETTAQGKAVKISIPSSYGFKTGSYELKRPMKDTLSKLSHFLRTYPETTIDVTGHTDNVGSESSNDKLGERRAEAVSQQLLKGNISPFRITSLSEGESLPICDNRTKEGRECNRRVDITVTLEKNLDF